MTARPPTDRERALQAEARVAELEDEVREWRAQAEQQAREEYEFDQLNAVADRLRPLVAGGKAMGAARLLLSLLRRPGRVCLSASLVMAISTKARTGEYVDRSTLGAAAFWLREALSRLGVPPEALRYVRPLGYQISVADAQRIRKILGLRS